MSKETEVKTMTNTNRWYVGLTPGKRETFCCAFIPTEDTHGKLYNACVGPFNTRKGAEFMRDYGAGNPHCRCVSEAERLARVYS